MKGGTQIGCLLLGLLLLLGGCGVPAEEQTSEPPPARPSLADLAEPGPKLILDGAEIRSIRLGDATLALASDLSARGTGFDVSGTGAQITIRGFRGETAALEFRYAETLEALNDYNGETGVQFAGARAEFWIPLWWLSARLGVMLLEDEAYGTVFLASPFDPEALSGAPAIPVLLYHSVGDDADGLAVSPESLEEQIRYLLRDEYDPIWFSDLGCLELYDRPVLLTFDGGYDDSYTKLLPILEKYRVKATVFVATDFLDAEHYLTSPQVTALAASGLVDIQSQTAANNALGELPCSQQAEEILRAQRTICRLTGKYPNVVAYPSGSRNDNTLAIAADCFDFGLDAGGGVWTPGACDLLRIPRVPVAQCDTIDDFIGTLYP